MGVECRTVNGTGILDFCARLHVNIVQSSQFAIGTFIRVLKGACIFCAYQVAGGGGGGGGSGFCITSFALVPLLRPK